MLSFSSFFAVVGPFLADFNETHVLNPRWPPHARFHNGQTMSTGAALGTLGLWYIWSPILLNSNRTPLSSLPLQAREAEMDKARSNLTIAAWLSSLFFLTGLTGGFYPGAAWIDPEFRDQYLVANPQMYGFIVFVAVAWAGWWLAMRALEKQGGKGKTV